MEANFVPMRIPCRFSKWSSSTAYIRMHGLNKKEFDYNYEYSPGELEELAQKLQKLTEDHQTVYCLFNNLSMHKNALQLKKILISMFE